METEDAVVVATATSDGLRVILQGQMNVRAAAELHKAGLQALEQGQDVLVECAQTEHLDASVLQVLLALKDGLREKGKELQLTGLSPSMHNFLRVAGLGDALLSASVTDRFPGS